MTMEEIAELVKSVKESNQTQNPTIVAHKGKF